MPVKFSQWSITPIPENISFQDIPGISLNWKAEPSRKWHKPRKVPYQPNNLVQCAKTNVQGHWSDFDTAFLNYELMPEEIEGIEINLYALDPDKYPVTALDLDNCLDPNNGTVEPWATKIVNVSKTYTELSPGGKGVRLFFNGLFEGGSFSNGSLE